jgi:glycosyltransferase involved in cell wall biosynthesis
MRIALNGMLLSGRFTGVETAIYRLAEGLCHHGKESYELFVPADFPAQELANDRFRTIRSGPPGRNRLARILWEHLMLPRHVRRVAADVVHAPGYVAPRLRGATLILTIYDLIALRHPEWCRRANALHYARLLPASARRADGIIVPSEQTRRDLVDTLGVGDRKIRVIPLGVDASLAPVADSGLLDRVRQKHDLPARYLLFVGQQEPKKNLRGLLESYRDLKQRLSSTPSLVLAGARGWGTDGLAGDVRRFGLEQDVRFTGYVEIGDLAALYSMADVFVFPSLYEGFGLPPLEAMACGVPVVCSDRGALPEVVGDAAVLVDPLRADELAGAIERVLTDGALRRDLVARGHARAATFTWERCVTATEDFYREVNHRASK